MGREELPDQVRGRDVGPSALRAGLGGRPAGPLVAAALGRPERDLGAVTAATVRLTGRPAVRRGLLLGRRRIAAVTADPETDRVGNRKPSDVAFIRALVDRERAVRPLDSLRTFACGHSSGAIMSYRLAAEASDLFAAVGVVAGTIGYQLANGRAWNFGEPQRPVAVIHFHGTDDPLVPYNGGSRRGEGNGVISVAESISFWVSHDGCDSTPAQQETSPDGRSTRQTYSGGRDGTEVTLWTTQGGGHEWPGWTPAQASPQRARSDISATNLIWQFFAAHPRIA